MDVLRRKEVIVRKPHVCWGCYSKILAGHYALHCVTVDGDGIVSGYWCYVCEVLLYYSDSDELCQGELRTNYPTDWQWLSRSREERLALILKDSPRYSVLNKIWELQHDKVDRRREINDAADAKRELLCVCGGGETT